MKKQLTNYKHVFSTKNQKLLNRIFFLSAILFLGLIEPVKAQEPCGTMQVLKEQLKSDPDMQKRIDERDKQIKMFNNNPQLLNDDLIVIPVVVHVIYHTERPKIYLMLKLRAK